MDDKLFRIGVHNGPMHSDEVFAVAVLSIYHQGKIEIVRTRDPELLKACDLRVDVGDNYSHESLDYDHHMAWFKVRHKPPFRKKLPDGSFREFKEGPLRSGFGLVWLHYGNQVVKMILEEVYPPEHLVRFTTSDLADIFESFDDGFVAYIDAVDNGENQTFYLNESPFRGSDLTKIISGFNPTVMEQNVWKRQGQLEIRYLDQFTSAVRLAVNMIRRDIVKSSEMIYYREDFMNLISKLGTEEEILVLEEYIPWFYAYKRAGGATNGVEMVVFPTQQGGWMCQTPVYYQRRDGDRIPAYMADKSQRRYKHHAPKSICGLRDDELVKITGIPDVTFVHKGGHLGAAKTKEAAIALAHYFVEKGR